MAIVNPIKARSAPTVAPTVILAGTQADLRYLVEISFPGKKPAPHPLYLGSVYQDSDRQDPDRRPGLTIAGPVLGAPFAAMMLETLIVWGAETVFFLGWCGAVSPALSIGDVVVPDSALIDEGTSRHYRPSGAPDLVHPTEAALDKVLGSLDVAEIPFHRGSIWTTDAIFRETRDVMAGHQKNGVLAVEMEFSALCAISRFRGTAVAGALVVSDRLADFIWEPGFRNPRFIDSRKRLARQLVELVRS